MLQGKLLGNWKSFVDKIGCFETVRIPGCYFTANRLEIQLHAFTNASEHAYGGVVFLRSSYEDGRICVR